MRVVVTGMSAVTPIGNSWDQVHKSLRSGFSGNVIVEKWRNIKGLESYLAAPSELDENHYIPPKKKRSMSRVSLIACQTADKALQMSGLNIEELDKESIGVAYGSSFGSSDQLVPFGRVVSDNQVRGISPTGYIQIMGHTAAVNLSLFLGVNGRLIPTSSACASGGQAIGYAFEAIQNNIHPIMIAGSAEELSPAQVAVFDSFYAASREHENPRTAARPFSRDRNGIVVGEGGATFVLESFEHAQKRNAPILAEIVGFATNTDGRNIIKPNVAMMIKVMKKALESASLKPEQVGYINVHAAGSQADAAEAQAIQQLFGCSPFVSSTKGHTGHLLGGCGAVEAWLSINMMNQNWYVPTLNLTDVADDCSGPRYIVGKGKELGCDYVMSNNFAFGGVNASLIFKRYDGAVAKGA